MPSSQIELNQPAIPPATRRIAVRQTAIRRIGLGFALVLTLGACSTVSNVASSLTPNFRWVYKIDIQQGSVVTQEMAAQLKPGMTREQVRFVLGTPPLTDIFHTDRWDYPYTMQRRGGPIEKRSFVAQFEQNRLKSFGGDPLPTEQEFNLANPIAPAEPENPSLWEQFKGMFD